MLPLISFISAFLGLSSLPVTWSQFVPTPTGYTVKTGCNNITLRYKQVPTGICELDPNVKSYAGYADVSENEHYFFWLFEARSVDPKTAPLTSWVRCTIYNSCLLSRLTSSTDQRGTGQYVNVRSVVGLHRSLVYTCPC